ncbi:AMP-binding protein [Streptomyces sp. BH106]|uniref:AMP-binding protein n=1 Tax=Streptomyces sp. BH106 TaxID=3410409 RepID=UPI003CE8A7B3
MIHRSGTAAIHIPDTSLSAHVLAKAPALGDRPALVDAETGEVVTYAGLVRSVERGASGLAGIGVGQGDVVAVMSHNQPRFAVVVHAALGAGAAVSPLNPALTVDEIAKQLADSGACVLVVAEACAAKGYAAAQRTGGCRVLTIGEPSRPGSWDVLVTEAAGVHPVPEIDPASTPAALPYSSGTTGLPKGVVLTHRNLVANLEQIRHSWRITETDTVCAVLPFFHIYGFTIILNSALLAGATIVTMPRFELRRYLETVERHRVTRGHLAPPMVLALARSEEAGAYDLSTMRTAVCGAAPLDEELAALAEQCIGCVIRQGYGMTEAGPGTHATPDEDFAAVPAGSVGRLLPGTEARLVDVTTGRDADGAAAGELWVRGPQVMAGYLGNRAATEETLVDGWLRTGDIARVDAKGNFYVVDRLKELIKYKGYQIAPAELEALLISHPDIADAAVVAMPHPTGGEAPKAFVVPCRPLDPRTLLEWVGDRVAPYKRIRTVEFVDTIPKSPAGKILRRELKNA